MQIHVSIVDDEAESRPDDTSPSRGGLSVVISLDERTRERSLDPETLVRNIVGLFAVPTAPQFLDRLAVRNGNRIVFVKVCDVDWIEAEGNYVLVHAGKSTFTLRESIGALERQLDPARFRRIHRSTIVSVERIRELRAHSHGDYRVVLETGAQLTLSRGYRDSFKCLLDKEIAPPSRKNAEREALIRS